MNFSLPTEVLLSSAWGEGFHCVQEGSGVPLLPSRVLCSRHHGTVPDLLLPTFPGCGRGLQPSWVCSALLEQLLLPETDAARKHLQETSFSGALGGLHPEITPCFTWDEVYNADHTPKLSCLPLKLHVCLASSSVLCWLLDFPPENTDCLRKSHAQETLQPLFLGNVSQENLRPPITL